MIEVAKGSIGLSVIGFGRSVGKRRVEPVEDLAVKAVGDAEADGERGQSR